MNLKGDSSERRSCLARQYFHEHNFVNFDLLPSIVLQLFQKVARNANISEHKKSRQSRFPIAIGTGTAGFAVDI